MKTNKSLLAPQATCQGCGKPIQYVTSTEQAFCSNACRSHANQARRVASQAEGLRLVVNPLVASSTPGINTVPLHPTAQAGQVPTLLKVTKKAAKAKKSTPPAGSNVEELWQLLEKALQELAQAKAQQQHAERELAKFRRVTGKVYYLAS
jgi:predicted nucleic acid-binding Zn ribbon protein